MDKRAIGSIILLIIVLILFFNQVIFPLIKYYTDLFNNTAGQWIWQKPSFDPLPYTRTISQEIIKWVLYIFSNPLPLAIILAIGIIIWLIEFRWS